MMKKKSLAVAMAAVTVAMPASQVFAAVVDNNQTEEIKAMKEKAKELMNLKYTTNGNLLSNRANNDEYVFNIELTTPNNTDICKSFAEFERKFDSAYAKLEEGQSLKIGYKYAKETGYNKLEDGQIVDFKLETYTEKELEKLAINFNATTGEFIKNDDKEETTPEETTPEETKTVKETKTTDEEEIAVGQVRATELSDDGDKKFEIRLSNDKNGLERYKEIKVGDVEIALTDELADADQENNTLTATNPIVRQVNDYYVDVDGNAITSVEDGDLVKLNDGVVSVIRYDEDAADQNGEEIELTNAQIDGFYASTTTEAETPQIKMDVITKAGTQNKTLNSSELFTVAEGRVTTAGNDLVRQINFYQGLEEDQKFYGDTYRVENKETAKDKEITVKIFRTDEVTNKESKIAEIKVVRDDKDNKAESYRAIRDMLDGKYDGYTRVAAGDDRYETAAEVSKMTFTGTKLEDFKTSDEKAVVLVTGAQDKLVDGLTATPLAAVLNAKGSDSVGAPVLLTGNDKIAKPVLDEIERLGAEKVYIVGGAISPEVEKELKNVHGLKVDRVSGDDRYDTSIEVADEMLEHTDGEVNGVFVVGGKGEADALSAASAAAKEHSPILLTNKDKLSKDVKFFINKDKENDKVTVDATNKLYVVGGNSSVSNQVYNDLLDEVGKDSIKRLSGDDRQDTNAKVATEFFSDAENAKSDTKATKVVVAKSDNKGMVDALGAGLYAGLNEAPVILATNNLTEDQEDYLNDYTNIDKTEASKVMVGNGISSTIAKFIKSLNTIK